MQLNELKKENKNTKSRRVGRGGKRGKTSGKGHKGQKARAGKKIRPEARDAIKKIPKRRGHGKNRGRTVNSSKVKPIVINLNDVEKSFSEGEMVNSLSLLSLGLIKKKKGNLPKIKVLSMGEITKGVKVEGLTVSKVAREKIEAAGGTIV